MENEVSRDVQRLLDQFVDGTIADEELSRLDESMRNQPELVDYFLDYCQLHIDLAIDLRADKALESFRDRQAVVAGTVAAPLPMSDETEPLTGRSPGHSLFGFSGFLTLGIAACTVMLVAAAGLWWWVGYRRADDRAPLQIAGTATHSVPQVSSIQINSGSSKFELDGIGTVLLEGPADFELTGPMRARLNRGRIKVHVTQESGHGFVVETPDGEVTDLGTAFGLDVADHPGNEHRGTGLVVFQGAVDLRVGEAEQISGTSPMKLFGGDGVRFNKSGQLNRIMSVVTGSDGTFQLPSGSDSSSASIITHVADNIRDADTKKFYEIVPGGMKEDALAYVDRQEHEWNGATTRGLPDYLIGADYVKTFNRDKVRPNIEIEVALSSPARLFIFWDDRLQLPDWLRNEFRRNGDRVGLDMGNSFNDDGTPITRSQKGIGPGVSIDQTFSVWEREVTKPGVVKLYSTGTSSRSSAMYGIAAKAIEPITSEPAESTASP